MRIETEVMLAQSKENVKKLLDEIEAEGQEGASAVPTAPVEIPGRAAGGGVNADQPYVVGELGPEIFVPAQEGLIVPNSEIVGADAGLKASEKFGASPEEDLSGGKLTSALTQFATATETEDDDKSKADNLMAKAKELMAMQSKLQGGKINAS